MLTAVFPPFARHAGVFLAAAMFIYAVHGVAQEADRASEGATAEGKSVSGVVWILLDACRADHLSCYGYGRPTSPNIDALAERGTLFERNYAQAPNTLLSVSTFMTGRYEPVPYQDARHQNIWFLLTPPEHEVLVSSIFSDNGYATAMFSASPWYTQYSRLGKSFDTFAWLAHGENVTGGSFEKRSPELFEWLNTHAHEPFFVYIHSLDTHEPRFHNNTHDTWLDPSFPKDRDAELRKWKGAPYSSDDRVHIRDLYDGAISYADETVGEIVAKLKALGVLESTLIVISADHGEILGDDGETLGHPGTQSYDDLLHVPLIIAGPGFSGGRRVAAKTQNVDIVPSLVDLLSLKTDARFDGTSLLPKLASDFVPDPDDYVFAHTQAFMVETEPNRILIYDDIKFDISPLNKEEMRLFKISPRKHVEIYAMPDFIGGRHEVKVSSARVAQAEKIVRDRFVPLWEEREKQPKEVPPLSYIEHGNSIVPDAIVDTDDPSDNKWHHRRRGLLGDPLHEDDYLVSYSWSEDAPGLIFGVFVPNGTYAVSVFSKTLKYGNTVRGTSFRFLVSPESEWRLFEIEPGTAEEPNRKWFDIGTYTVTNGQFEYWLDQGNEDDFAVIGSLKFVRVGSDAAAIPSVAELEAERERLESLGYFGK